MQGIYGIRCLINQKIYIGSSKNINNRWTIHRNQLNKKIHKNTLLQRAWIKYEKENFEFFVIEETKNLFEEEQKWMDYYQSYKRSYGYNICETAEVLGHFIKSKKWIVTKPNGQELEITNIYNFCREEDNGLDASCMIKVAKGDRNQHKGYKCRPNDTTEKEWTKTKKRHWKGCKGWQGKWIIKWPDGKEEIINALTTFCKNNNLYESAMGGLANGVGWHHKGFQCIRLDGKSIFKEKPKKQYLVITPTGQEIIVENLSVFARENNLIEKSMHQICNKQWNHKGYKCRKL